MKECEVHKPPAKEHTHTLSVLVKKPFDGPLNVFERETICISFIFHVGELSIENDSYLQIKKGLLKRLLRKAATLGTVVKF